MNRRDNQEREPYVREISDEELKDHFQDRTEIREITRDETPVLEKLVDAYRNLDRAEVMESTDERNKNFILNLLEKMKTDPELVGAMEGYFGKILDFFSEEDLERKRRLASIFGGRDPKEEILDKAIHSFSKLVGYLERRRPEHKNTLQSANRRDKQLNNELHALLEGESNPNNSRQIEAFLKRLNEDNEH